MGFFFPKSSPSEFSMSSSELSMSSGKKLFLFLFLCIYSVIRIFMDNSFFLILITKSSTITAMHTQLGLSLGTSLTKKCVLFLSLWYFGLVFKYFYLKIGWVSNAFLWCSSLLPKFNYIFLKILSFWFQKTYFFFETTDITI